MSKITQKQQNIINILLETEKGGFLSSSAIQAKLTKTDEEVSLVTVKRRISEMARLGLLVSDGAGPATKYMVSPLGRLCADIDARAYCAAEPDKRYGMSRFNLDLLPAIPPDIFSAYEMNILE